MNQVIAVGRLTAKPKLQEKTEERAFETAQIVVAIPQSFKNIDGEYDTNFVPFKLIGQTARTTSEYCEKGDIIGIKGRIQCLDGNLELIAEKITFLSSSNSKKEESEEGEE